MQESSKEFVEYKSFDELSIELKEKFKSETGGWNLKQAKDGYVAFINLLNQRGDELVGGYIKNSVKTQVKFGKCGHVAYIRPNSYKRGQGCAVCRGLQVQRGVNDLATTTPFLIKEWHPIKNELTPRDVTKGSHKKVWWKCENDHEWEATIDNRVGGNGCPYCSNQKVLKGFNDIFTTHLQYIKYFVNVEDAHTCTGGSNKKVELKCPDCSHTKMMTVGNLTKRGFSCDLCSDGISYPEKLMASILSRLCIEFTKQLSFDKGGHKYDFYLPKYNAILETHGRQHYEHQGFEKFGKTLKKEQENDRYKRELAISKGLLEKDYHEIDCRYSTLEWCRPNIERALSNYIDMSILTGEDWKQVDIKAQKSLKIEVCKYWRENKDVNGNLTSQRVADVFGIVDNTVREYLKWGETNGYCTYDGKKELIDSNRRRSTFVYLIKPNGDKWFNKPMSMIEMERQTGISQGTIKRSLDKGALKYHKNSKYDPKYIGSYIVSAEVYDNQIQVS